jgi:hypothetical protein
LVILPINDKYLSGYEFQEYVKQLLALSGYLEGQIYSTGLRGRVNYLSRLHRMGKISYTSPDILIANKWMEDTPTVEFRFGLSCGRRDRFFYDYEIHPSGEKSVTFPTYQRRDLEKMQSLKKLEIYLVFGKKVDDNFAIGVAPLREPDSVTRLTDTSTGKERWNDVYYVKSLMNWKDFIRHRREKGDKEPDLRYLRREIPWLGDFT